MGVPKFYRWISERYPCLSEVVKEHQISEFDNLYLDMNGIVHVVSHPDDSNPHFRISEEKIFHDIFHYIEVLFRLIKPRKVFFMAIDGVAPRAKMNQQRGRRFRSAREAEELIAKAIQKGETLPNEERFDSNCITPGTPFMVRLQEQLKYFVVDKITNNELWQGARIYLSGHETPGEGEHKIMDFIRSERSNPDHDPNTRHCLYGLDADLIMLGLTSHEPHFSLLREEVRFGGKDSQKRSTTPEDTTFHLLHLSLLREYIDFEFVSLKSRPMSFPYDLERVIDDWVLMGFLVGNDFIPNLPSLHIHQDGLPLLWGAYMKLLPKLDGYLNEHGKINLPRLEKFMSELAKYDYEQFSENYADLKWFAGKTGKESKHTAKRHRGGPKRKYNMRKAEDFRRQSNAMELSDDYDDDESFMFDDVDDDDAAASTSASNGTDAERVLNGEGLTMQSTDTLMMAEFRHHKRGYYMEKFHVDDVTLPFLRDQALQYVRALQWILYYYYDGCPSWSWFYPYHYAPYISDVREFSQVEISFDLSRPFLPFQQLMSVLPASSKKLLPEAYQPLMTEASSPIVDFYPTKFETDLNGKQQEWEAVVLVPFIDEKRLIAAMDKKEKLLTKHERERNIHSPCLLYTHSRAAQGAYRSPLPGVFPDILVNHANLKVLDLREFIIPRKKLKRGLFEGVLLDVHYPGFPTFKHLPHKVKLKKANVKVFQSQSRGENMVVTIQAASEAQDLEAAAKKLLGQTVFVRWPHLVEARVEAISDSRNMISIVRPANKAPSSADHWQRKALNEFERNKFRLEQENVADQLYSRRGIVLGPVDLMVYVTTLLGRRYICGSHGNITLDKQYSQQQEYCAHQSIVTDLLSHNPGFQQFTTIGDLFRENSHVFMLGQPHYGCQGKVLGVTSEGRVRVEFVVPHEPDLTDIEHNKNGGGSAGVQYLPAWVVAQRLSVSPLVVARVTGSFRIANGQGDQTINVGLNLKSNAKGEEVPGYTKKVTGVQEKNQWLYSTKVVQVLQEYMKKFPRVFELIQSTPECDIEVKDLFPKGSSENVGSLTAYVKGLECAAIPRVAHGCHLADEQVVMRIEDALPACNEINRMKRKVVTMQVRPHLLYKPIIGNNLLADATARYQLYDRVVNIRMGFSVPLGLRGTIIGIYPAERDIDTMYEVLFDEEFVDALKIRSKKNRGYRMNGIALCNITYGEHKARPANASSTSLAGKAANQNKNNNRSATLEPRAWGNTSVTGGSPTRQGHKRPESEFNEIWRDLKQPTNGDAARGLLANGESEIECKRLAVDHSYSSRLRNEQSTSGGGQRGTTTAGGHVTDGYTGKMTVLSRKKSTGQSRQSNSYSKSVSAADDTTRSNCAIGSLSQAAAALPNVTHHILNFNAQKNSADIALVKQTPEKNLQDSLTQSKSVSKSKSPVATSDEFAALMSCLNITTEKSGADTCRDRQELNKGLGPPATAQVDYGRKVSVEELFQVAAEKKGENVADTKDHEMKLQPQKNACEELDEYCKVMKFSAARYEYMPAISITTGRPDNESFICLVTVGDQLRFQSSASKSRQKASLSAAAVALSHIRRAALGVRPSAFTPVRGPATQGYFPGPGLGLQRAPSMGHRSVAASFIQYPMMMLNQHQQQQQLQQQQLLQQQHQQHQFAQLAMPLQFMAGAAAPMRPRFTAGPIPAVQQHQLLQQQHHQSQQQQLQQTRPSQAVYVPPAARHDQIRPHAEPLMSSRLTGCPLLQQEANKQIIGDGGIRPELHGLQFSTQAQTLLTSMVGNLQQSQPITQVGSQSAHSVVPPTAASMSDAPVRTGRDVSPIELSAYASNRKRSDSTGSNPFVPLQVSRQQKTPQKKSIDPDEVSETCLSANDSAPGGNGQVTTGAGAKNANGNSPLKNNERKPKKQRNRKPRLAAKFPGQ